MKFSTLNHAISIPLIILAALASPAAAQPAAVDIDARWVFAADGVHPGQTIHAALQVSLEEGYHVQSNQPLDEFLVPTKLTLTPPPGVTVREIVYPKTVKFEIAGDVADVFEQDFTIGVALDIAGEVEPGAISISGILEYQACDDKVCLMPSSMDLKTTVKVVAADEPVQQTNAGVLKGITFTGGFGAAPTDPQQPTSEQPAVISTGGDCDVLAELADFTVMGTAGGYMNADDFIAFIDRAETGSADRNVLEGKGPLAIMLLVLIGGILLNLTPCVLPLIPINLAIIGAGTQASSRARGFALGGTYGLAMALVYGALGLIVTLTAAPFGQINSTIWFNVAIAALFVVLALAMFDVIAIDFTKYQANLDASRLAKHGKFVLAFGMGAVSALLAGACVAPVVIQVVVYSGDQYAKGSAIALALPFFLGLGMALPWPFAGAGLSLLPKPGKWMVRVKQAMGVFIIAFGAYYGYNAWQIFDSTRVDPDQVRQTVQKQLEGGWTASICDGLAQARAENKPVLIDMWATWCKACLAMDKTTFKDDRVLARLDNYVKIKYQAENLNASPNREMLERFEQIGLPAYAILRPAGGDEAQLARDSQ